MKDNLKYSKTAKERKMMRGGVQTVSASGADIRKAQESAALAAQKRSKRSTIAVITILSVAVVMIMVALIVPVVAYMVNPYRDYKSVVARFNLSNGMVLEYEIDETRYEIAATNFIFLAKNGYFDNTVLFDAQNGWLRFGGYEAQPGTAQGLSSDYNKTHHHSQNVAFCESFSALPSDRFASAKNKFGYNLKADKGGTNVELFKQAGVLTYIYKATSTEYQFCYDIQEAKSDIRRLESDGKQYTEANALEPTMVGYALNDETVENLVAIAALAQLNTAITYGYLWMPPTPDIYIESVKVYNLDPAKWDNFDFINYMNEISAIDGWTGRI